jgi:hypothetical protein
MRIALRNQMRQEITDLVNVFSLIGSVETFLHRLTPKALAASN